jgi:hypothetical protein
VSEYLKRDNLRTVLDDESVRIGAQLMARMMRDICKGMSVIHKYARTTRHDTTQMNITHIGCATEPRSFIET